MAMREDCKYFQRRIYASGDEAQFCALGLAPEAPWRCPAACPRYTRRPDVSASKAAGGRRASDHDDDPLGDDGRGGTGDVPAEQDRDLHPDAVALLSSAEEIIGAVGPEIE
ncbi:MAG: hypothetical protein ACYDEN_07440, partial [Acidimicrobiales bacterium]